MRFRLGPLAVSTAGYLDFHSRIVALRCWRGRLYAWTARDVWRIRLTRFGAWAWKIRADKYHA